MLTAVYRVDTCTGAAPKVAIEPTGETPFTAGTATAQAAPIQVTSYV